MQLPTIFSGMKAFVIAALLALAACGGGPDRAKPVAVISADAALRANTAALQKTILEGVLAGAGAGSAIGLALGDANDARTGFRIGATAGLLAGSYVGFIQQHYIWEESKLNRVIDDLRANNALLETTLASMRAVLAETRTALAAADDASRVPVANAARDNLGQMQLALSGALTRQAEFLPVRSLNLGAADGRTPDPELAVLADRIAAMQAIAAEMQGLL